MSSSAKNSESGAGSAILRNWLSASVWPLRAAEKIKSNADAGKMVKEYIMAQMKSDYAKLAGQETDEQEYRHLQELALLISNNSDAQEYLQAFIRWNQVAADIQKIISDAMAQGMDVLDLQK